MFDQLKVWETTMLIAKEDRQIQDRAQVEEAWVLECPWYLQTQKL